MRDRAACGIYTFLALAAVAVPPALDSSGLPTVRSSYGDGFRIFEIFGFSATIALAVVVWRELAKRRGSGLAGALPVIAFAVVAMSLLMLVCEYTQKFSDYECYEEAAKMIEAGRSPYLAHGYIYPPPVADGLALAHQTVMNLAGLKSADARGWHLVFYLWQCAQFFLAILAYLLCVRFARVLGARGFAGIALVAVVFLFNGPLVRTFRLNQPNLWMFDAILFALVFGARYAGTAGSLLGFAATIKLYPLAMLLPIALAKRWRMLAGLVAVVVVVVLVEPWLSMCPRAWERYVTYGHVFPAGNYFRDNGLHSIAERTVWLVGMAFDTPRRTQWLVTTVLWRCAVAAAAIFIGLRIVRREQAFAALPKQEKASDTATMLRFTGQVVDTFAFALMASPIAWEHHYLLAVPMVLWAMVTQRSRRPWLIWLGSALMLLPPSFEIYPFGYHRIAGLVMVLIGTSPRIDLAEYDRNVDAWRVLATRADGGTETVLRR